MKKKLIPIIVSCSIILVLIAAGTAYAINVSKNSHNNEVDVHLADSGIKTTHIETDGTQGERVASTVEIQLDDCAVAVGTVFKAVAIITPADTERSAVWTSSNPDSIDVDSEGNITVKGIGVSVITVTVGTVSDSVAIEGIQNASMGSQNGFGVYVADSFLSDKYGDSWINPFISNSNDDEPQSGNQDNTPDSNDVDKNENHENIGKDENYENQDTPSNEDYSDGNFDNNNHMPDDTTQNNDSSNNDSEKDQNHTTGGSLNTQGFSQVMSNVYIYQEDDTYYGEIVTQPNVTIIYIKKRGDRFDTQIQNVLASLLPSSYDQVWNNYLTANTDKTFVVDNRKVRIVVAPKGGHSQIVIYN